MRLILGMIIGAGLTIGGAYIHDSKLNGPFEAQQRLVNWDVAGNVARNAYDSVRSQIRGVDWLLSPRVHFFTQLVGGAPANRSAIHATAAAALTPAIT
jgi:hypothetical protein